MFQLDDWRDVPGYEGLYQASPSGVIRSVVKRSASCRGTLKTSVRPDGYANVSLFDREGSPTTFTAHKVILTTFRGPRPPGCQAAHLNGVRTDNRLTNLIWATVKENHSHKRIHGTDSAGERNPQSVLSEAAVAEIRRDYRPYSRTFGTTALAKRYGVTPNTIWTVVKRKSWNHVQ